MQQQLHEVPFFNGDRPQTQPHTGLWARFRAAVRPYIVRACEALRRVVCRWIT